MTDKEPLIPRFQCPITVHDADYSLREALKEMSEEDYSQVVVRVDGHLRLLTLDALGWAMAEAWDDDFVDIKHAGIRDYVEDAQEGTMVVMARDRTVAEARDVLMQLNSPRVYAIVVTDSGNDEGQPLGIVTPWDLSDD